jgi:hypothetical protein
LHPALAGDSSGVILVVNIVPCELDEANSFVAQHHRHHRPVVGHKFSLAVEAEGKVVGVAIVGRPVARLLQDGETLEVVRVATNGTRNACSALYSACWRAARAMGYRRLVTYILDSEPGTSVRAAGWKEIGKAGGGTWNRGQRPRVDKHPTQGKIRFEVSTETGDGG